MYSNTYTYSLAIITVFTITASGKYFEPGYDHHYVYKSTSDYLGMQNVTSVMKFHIRFLNSSGNGNLHSLYLDSFVQFSQSGYYADNPLHWNLSKPFLFRSTHDGVVEMVHIHPEDQDEVLTLKKVLASTLSVKVMISNESTWDYTSNERDHLGDLTHEYRSEKTSSGVTLRRYHRSLDKIERIHEKISQMDNRGTIHSVESEDSYIMEDRLRKDYETKRQPYPEEYVIKTSMEGDIGIIKANSKTTMRLVGKRRTKVEDVHHGLMEDDLIIKQKAEERLTMKNISGDVIEALGCIHNYTDKGHTNRTICVNRLRQKVLKLEKEDYDMLAESFLNRTCDENDTKCIDEKYLFTDIVARAGDPLSQRLILKFLLSDKQSDTEALRRIFIHLSVIEHPIQEAVAVVERICFGEQDSHHTIGKIILTETERRACLCLGSMAKAMNSKGNNTEAERLMDKIHTWLYTQGDVTPDHLRPKREILVADDSVSDDHLLSKVVLLHSLGNAGLQSSISHLKTFAEPNTRQSAWRRAALSSLRNYVCHESATILLTSILHDETESVRQVAWMEYGQHPKRNNLTTEQQNLLFSRKYTYETVMRARREAALDTVLIEFKVELPEIHWGKSVGNSEIGASFGVDMVNKLHIRLQPLSGFLRVNIFDRIYAEAHVGILGLEVDILKIVACYKGKIEYNMNVLKHFAYGKDQELFESFNAAADEIIGPIVQSVKGMSDNFKSSSGESRSIFQSLSDAIRDIPSQTKKFLDASIKLTSLLDRFHGLPLISRAKYVAFKLQSLAEDIKNDALTFYQTISDAGLVTLLHAEEQLTEATNSIMEAQKKVGSSPRQAFESLSAAKNRITIGMQQILEAKSKMSEALSGHGGSLPGWLSAQEETQMLTDAVENMILKVKSKIKSYEAAATSDDGTDLIDFSSLKNIEEALQECLREVRDIYSASEPFLKAFTDTMRKVKDLKNAVELIDKATKASQRKVLANFGAKFHPKFPSQRRDTDRNCGKGTWPSTSGGMYNDSPGIDVLDWNEKIPCPISGYVMRTCTPDEVLIIPTGEQFKGYEVLIRNINPSSEIPFDQGIVMNAGDDLGSGRGKGICDDSYIHVAIRQREGSEKSCSYIDPSSFVDNPKPFPKWEQECKEFTFKHIGQIIEAGLSGKGFEDLFGKLIKRAVAWAAAEIIDKISMAFPKSPFVAMAGKFSLGYLSKYNKMIAKVFLKNNKHQLLGTALGTACGEQSTTQSSQTISAPKQPGDEQDDPSVSKKTMSQTYEALEMDPSNGKHRLQAIQSAIQNLQKAASELPLENMVAMPFLRYGQILTRLDVPSRGGKQSMPTMLQMLLWKACPTFENGLVQGYGHICIPLEGCTGLNCSISIPNGITTSKLPVMVKFDLEAMMFRIDMKNESINIPIAENPVNIHLRQTIFAGYKAILVSQATNITIDLGHAYQLTQSMHLCDAELTCLQNVGIFHDLTFFQHRGRIERSADGECSVSFGANFQGHGKVSAGLDINSNGQIVGGGINGEINVGDNGKITGGFHGNTDGTWHTDLGTELDVGDGTTMKGSVAVDVNKDGKVSYGVGVEAQFGDKGSIGGFVKGNSDGEITAGVQGSVKIGNDTLKGGGWIQHDRNGTQGGGMASVDLNGKGSISASVNASSDGTINAGMGGEMRIGNTSIQAEGHVHHDKNGTSGGISVGAQFGNNGQLKTSLEGNSNGEITGGLEGDMKLGNGSSVHGALYVHHDKNGTSGGGLLSGNFGKDGHLEASVNRSNSGAIDAGLGGQLNMGNTSIDGEAHVHHDQNGTSGGGSLSAHFGNNNSLAASVEGNSDGTVKGQVEGTVHVGNGTLHGAGYVQHDSNGTSGGGMLSGDLGKDGHFQASVNRSNSGAIDAGLGGQLNMGNTSINGEAHVHHDQNGTSGGGSLSAHFGNNNSLAASVEGNSDGTIKGQVEGTVHVGNGTLHGSGYVQQSQNGTSGWIGTIENEEHTRVPYDNNTRNNVITLSDGSKGGDEPISGPKVNNVTDDSKTVGHNIRKRNSEKCSFDMTGNFDASGHFKGLGVGATIPGFGKVGANINFQDGHVVGDISIGDFTIPIPNADNLNLELFRQMSAEYNSDEEDEASEVENDMKDGIRHKLVTVEKSVTVGLTVDTYEEDAPARDKKDGVEYKDRHIDITIFKVGWTFGVGPIGLTLEFGAGGAIGMSMWSDVRANSGTAAFSIGPWLSGMVWGGITLELGIASGGLKLIGYILKTKFPVTEETQQGKHPVTVVMKIDLELTPIELSLRGWAKVFGAKVFDKRLWSWACEPITWNILTKKFVDNDQDAPQFINGGFCGNTTRFKRSVDECSVKQLIDRHPTDPAFQIEVYTNDENSVVTQFYGIGTYPGGTDVVRWTEFRGSTLIVPMQLPNGIPLYFTIKAENSQGLKSYLKCKLDTYDTTLPGGRVEASHPFTSLPNQIAGTVIMIEDSPVIESYHALGYSPGEYGTQVTSWQSLDLGNSALQKNMNSDLKYFSNPREGRLSTPPVKVIQIRQVEGCASQCKQYGPKCMSFDFEETSESCNFHDSIEGGQIKLHIDGRYKNYERLDVGYTAYISYNNINIQHGAMYYINALIKNSLHYVSVLHSGGTMADFTPPEPGNVGRPVKDVMEAKGCNASVIQRCEQVTWLPNHRKIIDGSDGTTIFNGHKPLQEVRYTISNHYISANWDGFHDVESGIYGFTWASGTNVCGTNILQYTDPHAHLSSSKFWTYSGYAKDLHLPDGQYYVTIQAVNNVVCGGAMVTTVCHSTPVTVDTTPPVFSEVSDVMYDEDFDILAVYYNVSDPLSGILRVDFGLGRTKHDVELRPYSRHNYMVRDDPFLVIENLDLEPGIPAWIRLRAVNNVELFGSGHSNEPIMVDKTPPLPGKVLDGDVLGQDREYQHDTDKICSQWIYFYDPESGINQFIWGVGTAPGKDNILPYRNLSSTTKRICQAAELKHNVTYYSTIIAYNDALNAKRCNGSSNGILVDTTPPRAGSVFDVGNFENTTIDIAFSSESATVKASWNNFSDAESFIASYAADIYINREHVKTLYTGTDNNLLDHSLSLKHLDNVYIDVLALNGADLSVRAASDGFLVDHTPPNVIFLEDSVNGEKFQSDKSKLSLRWDFEDAESGIAEYRYVVNELYMGRHRAIIPKNGKFETLIPSPASLVNLDLHTLNLLDGALYTIQVTALNKARLSSSHESAGIIVDTSPPSLSKVHIGRPIDEEELDESGYVLHASQSSITVSWRAFDPESGIKTVLLAIGTIPGNMSGPDGSVTVTSDDSVAELSGLKLQPTTGNDSIYYVSVQVVNKAGLKSSVNYSKPIKILKANVAGTVYDGTIELQDIDFSSDATTIAMSFNGFESEACNIIGYEWAIGSLSYGSDVLPFTDYGIVMINDTFGHAQINLQLYENQLYFSTVRARTGHNCHEQYIVSTSDGFKVDTTGPRIVFVSANNTYTSEDVYDLLKTSYQELTDSIHLTWNVTDLSGVNDVIVSVGHLPYIPDKYNSTETKSNSITPGDVKLQSGEAVFVNILATDMSGLRTELSSPAIVTDVSSPDIHDFSCTDYISIYKTLLTCTWSKVEEYESSIESMSFAFGTKSLLFDIANFTNIPLDQFGWTRDMHSFVGRDDVKAIFTAFRVQNILGLIKVLEFKTVVDKTPPVGGDLIFTTQMGGIKDIRRELCQIPTTYVEVNATEPVDEESSIERYEVALGTSIGSTDILSFRPVSSVHSLFLGDLALPIGSTVFASMKVYNRAGLYSVVNSDGMVVSPHPLLTVDDGPGGEDLDFQSKMSVIEGNWHYSDPCPVVSAEWSIVDLTGKIIQNFTAIAGVRNHFYNDEISTENGFTYISIIRIEDAIGRSYTAETDGVTIRIQTPSPGYINDGLEQDTNFQISTTELAANWGGFGDPTSDNPVQKISHYEVAVGNDRRFEKTRTNVHSFVNVGLNTSYTFTKLNLTTKIVQYYVTVRAYSQAGSFEEVYSNGIRVGYHEGVTAGKVQHNRYQDATNRVVVSWYGFTSDYGIRQYEVGISNNNTLPLNKTMECKVFYQRYSRAFDVQSLISVSTNTYTALENLTLQHDNTYYVTVVATDESGMCIAMNAGPLTIDITPPSSGTLIFDGTSGHVNFVTDERSMHVSWKGFEDKESGIQYFNISLMSGYDCSHNEMIIVDSIIQSVTVYNLTETTFYNLNLESNHVYYVTLLAVNGAELNTILTSVPILLDTTYISPGTVKVGYDWFHEIAIQSSLTEISTILAVARDEESHKCPHQEEIISPTTKLLPNSWIKLRQDFSPSCVLDGQIPIEIQMRHSDDLTNVVKGGISSKTTLIRQGLYTFVLKSLSGENMFASLAVASSIESIPSNITDIIEKEHFSKNLSLNSTNEEERGQNVIGQEDQYGAGFLIPGFPVENYTCYCLVWAKDMYKFEVKFLQLDICADKVATEYGIGLEHVNSSTGMTWQAKFVINGVEKITINSLHFKDKVAMFVYGFNDNDYIPPVRDPFSPFETKLSLNSIKVPISTDKPCMYGTGFYDRESSIKEIWIGIANSLNETGNVREMKLEKKFCLSCNEMCPMVCDPNCTYESPYAFDIMSFKISNLSLLSSSNISAREKGDTRRADDTNSFDSLHANSYFINVRILNFAGLETNVNSKAVIIDDTPPTATHVICTDPIHNQDEPAVFQGTNSSMAAFWDFEDDISQIVGYTVSIGSRKGFDDIVSNMAVGRRKSVVIHNLTDYLSDNETYFITVTATNEAKLKTSSSCNITIDLNFPNVADSGAGTMFSIAVTDAPPNVTFLGSSESIGVDWKNEDPDVEFFEMQIGSKKDIADILPRVKIGTKTSKKAAVINGHLWLDNIDINTNVQQFVLKNWTNESLNEAKRHGGYFHFEPGRCLNIGLYAISRSHLSSKIPVQQCCIKRESDVVISFEKEMSQSVIRSGNALKVSKAYLANSTDFHLSFKGLSGGLTVGLLRDFDWDSLYGSAASSDFKPYISSPESPTRTSRLLKKRILKYSGSPFFVAPAGETTIADYINVSLRFNKTEFERGITIPVLAEWNEDAEMWQAVHENCIAEENIDYDLSIYKSKICLPGINFIHSRTRRAITSYTAFGPRMFALFVVNKTLAQSTAQLITKEMSCMEDSFQGKLQIQYTDEENDSVSFQIFQGPGMGYANITEDGILYYKPNKDFAGQDTLTLMLKETSLPDGSISKPTEQVIHIVVKEVNDPPLLFLLLGNETINAKNMQHVSKNIESNSTLTQHPIGTYIAVDIDEHDNLSLLTRFDDDNGINVTMDDSDDTSDDLVTAFTAVTPRTIKTFDLTINMSAEFYGVQNYSVRISDNANTYSLPITLTLNVMINPCVFGTCQVNPEHNISCNDPVRTRSFQFFRCLCKSGYYGQWCHLEIDECSTNPCPALYDCHDMVADYKCTVNILHLLLIILGAAFVVALCILVYRRIKSSKAKLKVFPARCEFEYPLDPYEQLNFPGQGWQHGRLGQGRKLMDTSFQNYASDSLGLPPPYQEKDEGQNSPHHKRDPQEDNPNGNDVSYQDFRRGAQDPEISEHDMNLPSLLPVVGSLGAPHHNKLKLAKGNLESVKKITPIDV